MIVVVDGNGKPLEWEKVDGMVPICGQDFCDACGDCLACYSSSPCFYTDDGVHIWMVEDGKEGR